MSTALRVSLLFLAAFFGVTLAIAGLLADKTIYGLRPHAVDVSLPERSVKELLALAEAEDGIVTGVF